MSNDSIVKLDINHLHSLIRSYLVEEKERETGVEMIPVTGNPGGYLRTYYINTKSGKITENIYQ